YARRGYGKKEPLDDQLPPEQPRLLRRALELWIGERGHEEVCAQLPFAERDVISLTGVPRGLMTGESAQVVRLVPVPSLSEGQATSTTQPESEGSVTMLRRP